MKYLLLAASWFAFSLNCYAHEGHNKMPGAIVAPHGGSIQDLEHSIVEVVTTSTGISVYPFSHEMKALKLADVKIQGFVTLPKQKKKEGVQFASEGEAFTAAIDAKGSHRYSLELTLSHQGKSDHAKMNIEPQ